MRNTLCSAALLEYAVTTCGVDQLAPQPILKKFNVATVVVDLGDSLHYRLAVTVMVARTHAATICKVNKACRCLHTKKLNYKARSV